MTIRKRPPAAALLCAALAAAAPLACATRVAAPGPDTAGAPTTVLVVRHAEKDPASTPTNLDAEAGLPRARALAAIAEREGVAAIYSTPFCRTVQTAQPSAKALALPIHLLVEAGLGDDLGRCAPPIEARTVAVGGAFAPPAQAARLLGEHRGRTVLVVGHSNTVPALVEALGATSLCPALVPRDDAGRCELPEERYGDLFTVRVEAAGGAELDAATYGGAVPEAPPGSVRP